MDWITQAEEMETQEQNLANAIQASVHTNIRRERSQIFVLVLTSANIANIALQYTLSQLQYVDEQKGCTTALLRHNVFLQEQKSTSALGEAKSFGGWEYTTSRICTVHIRAIQRDAWFMYRLLVNCTLTHIPSYTPTSTSNPTL
jgi:hypothetical protein